MAQGMDKRGKVAGWEPGKGEPTQLEKMDNDWNGRDIPWICTRQNL